MLWECFKVIILWLDGRISCNSQPPLETGKLIILQETDGRKRIASEIVFYYEDKDANSYWMKLYIFAQLKGLHDQVA